MKTDLYKLFYAEPGQYTGGVVHEEQRRWLAMETLLFELYSIFGNGVLTGWEIDPNLGSDNTLYISEGSGHVGFKSAVTNVVQPVKLSIPSGITIGETGLKFYIFGKETETTNIQRDITFFASTNRLLSSGTQSSVSDSALLEGVGAGGVIIIGEVVLKYNEDTGYYIDEPTYEYRNEISLFSSLGKFIRNHIHIGGANDPEKINLARHVKGKLSGDQIESIDADKIKKGTINADRLPQWDHNDLTGKGSLTHEQIDTLLSSLNLGNDHYLNDTNMANYLQTVLMLKHIYLNLDYTLQNIIAYIPGFSLSTWVDPNTTAVIETDTHRIMGYLATPDSSDYISWATRAQFEHARDEYNIDIGDYLDSDTDVLLDTVRRSSNIQIDDNGIQLSKSLNFYSIDDSSENNPWIIVPKIIDSSFGSLSDVTISVNLGIFVFKLFTDTDGITVLPESWLGSSKIEFSMNIEFTGATTNPSHGDINFFLIGAPPKSGNIQYTELVYGSNSSRKVTVNSGVTVLAFDKDTDEYQKVSIDVSNFSNLSGVQGFGFYATTINGWDGTDFQVSLKQPDYSVISADVSNELKIIDTDKTINMYRYNDLYYNSDGFIIFRFNTDLTSRWDFVFWDIEIPTVNLPGGGTIVYPSATVNTRVSNTEGGLTGTSFKEVNNITHLPDQDSSKWIDVQVSLVAGGYTYERIYSPLIKSITLHYTVSSSATSHTWSTYEDWIKGYTMINVMGQENPDCLIMEDTSYVNAKYFIEGNIIKTVDDNDAIVTDKTFSGANLYKSPIQAFYKASAGFLCPTQFTKLLDGNYLIADTGNDRIVELNSDGTLYRAIQGNGYLCLKDRDLVILTATYNPRLGEVALCFSQRVKLTSFDFSKIVLSSEDKANQITLNETGTTVKTFGSCLYNNIVPSASAGSSSISGIETFSGNEQSIPSTFANSPNAAYAPMYLYNTNLYSTSSGSSSSSSGTGLTAGTSGKTDIPYIGAIGSSINQNFDSEGEVILITLSDSRRLQANDWEGEKIVILSVGAYTAPSSSSGTIPGGTTPGGTTPGGTTPYYGTLYNYGGNLYPNLPSAQSVGEPQILQTPSEVTPPAGSGTGTYLSNYMNYNYGNYNQSSGDDYNIISGTVTGGTKAPGGYNPLIVDRGGTQEYTYVTGSLYYSSATIETSENPYLYFPYITITVSNEEKIIVDPRYPVGYNIYRYGDTIKNMLSQPIISSMGSARIFSNNEFSTADLWKYLGDFDSDGEIKKTTLIDTTDDATILEIPVYDGDIIYHDILHPVSAEKLEDDSYIIAQAHKYSIINIDMNKNIIWYILDTTINYQFGQFGSAKYLNTNNILATSPPMKIVADVAISTSTIIDYHSTKYIPIDAFQIDTDKKLILVSEIDNSQLNSRAYIIDSTDDVIWEWGSGKLVLPTGCFYLDSGNVLVSC